MPNDTVRADARAMPAPSKAHMYTEAGNPSRRSAIGVLIAAGVGAAAPAIPLFANAAESADKELFALIEAAQIAMGRARTARDAFYNADEGADPGEPPAALIRRPADAGLFTLCDTRVGQQFLSHDINNIKFLLAQNRESTTEFGRAYFARGTEIVRASDGWKEARERTREAAGVPQAEARANAADDALDAIIAQIAALPARTAAGLAAKLTVAAPLLDPSPEEPFDEQTEMLVRSAIEDAARLAARVQEAELAS